MMTERAVPFGGRGDEYWLEENQREKTFDRNLYHLMALAQVARENGEDAESVRAKEKAALDYAAINWSPGVAVRITLREGADVYDIHQRRIREEPPVFTAHRIAGLYMHRFQFANDETGETVVVENVVYSSFQAFPREFESLGE